MRSLPTVAVGLWLTGTLLAQGQGKVVRVNVTSVAERSVYLDHGRDVGLSVGTFVRLFPPGLAPFEVEIRSISNTSARAELPPGFAAPPTGTPGEANVTEVTQVTTPVAPVSPSAPEHPPWTRQEGARGADQPLLVPTFGEHPNQRPPRLDGRLFASTQWSRDDGGDRSSDYYYTRLGVRADATNYLGTGERVRFAGEIDDRRVSLPDAPDDNEQNARLDLLSVAFGTESWAPTGIEAGRFYSQFLPEIGLVDGVEVVRRYEGGIRFGAGFGAYPLPFPARDTGDDLGVHAFFDYAADARRSFATTIGVQKTWHRGTADRDLVLLRVEGRPSDSLSLYGSAKIDVYTGSDSIKGSGVEVTEAYGAVRLDGSSVGTGLTASHFTWPELLREEYQNLPVELVTDGKVDRLAWNGWWRVSDAMRLAARTDIWRDQDRDGTSWGLDGDLYDVFGPRSSLSLSLFGSDGGYSQGPGLRLGLRAPLGAGAWRAGYRWHRYELTSLVTGPESYTRESIELGVSVPLGLDGDLDCALEHWFGDDEDAWALNLYLQWRF